MIQCMANIEIVPCYSIIEVVNMKKKIITVVLMISLALMGCSSTNVEYTENVDGEKIVVMKEGNTQGGSEDMEIYSIKLESMKKICSGEYGCYTDDGSILSVEDTGDVCRMMFIDPVSGEVKAMANGIEEGGNLFQISPDRKKILYLSGGSVKIINLSDCSVQTLALPKKPLDISAAWLDDNTTAYCDLNGNIHYFDISSGEDKERQTDSIHKVNISLINGTYFYIKVPESNLVNMDKNDKDYSFYMKIENTYGSTLAYSVRDNHAAAFQNPIEPFRIKSYSISPDQRLIALYFEDSDNNCRLFITSMSYGADSCSMDTKDLINISNEKILDYVWSNDSKKLIYSTGGREPGLYAVNFNGTSNNRLVVNKSFSKLDFNDSILAVETGSGEDAIYEIKIK